MSNRSKTVRVEALCRVEGEGGILIRIKGNAVSDVKFNIFEPPRMFEAFLRGRSYREVPDITARICGICPVAYQMSAVHAIEDAFGAVIEGPLRSLRRLIYCGEWIESHALHIYMLHAPDFLGYADALQMAGDHPERVQSGLQLKKAGNEIVRVLGGREIHPINVKVGGFYKVPTEKELAALTDHLKWALDAAVDTARWVATFDFPDFERDYEFVALKHPAEYPFNEGRLVSNKGLDISVHGYGDHFMEEQVKHSTALHSALKERKNYFVGPLARYNLNFDKLSQTAKEAAGLAGLSELCQNPFKSIIVRSVETVHACEEALHIISNYTMPDKPAVALQARESTGCACTEAPRGVLYHRYSFDEKGNVLDARIVPPTSQNQKTIEDDLLEFATRHLHISKQELTWQCEQAVRNYDPCISCSTHVAITRENLTTEPSDK